MLIDAVHLVQTQLFATLHFLVFSHPADVHQEQFPKSIVHWQTETAAAVMYLHHAVPF